MGAVQGAHGRAKEIPIFWIWKGVVHRLDRTAWLLSGVERSQGAPSGVGAGLSGAEGLVAPPRPGVLLEAVRRAEGCCRGWACPCEPAGQKPGDQLCCSLGLAWWLDVPSAWLGRLCRQIELVQGQWC